MKAVKAKLKYQDLSQNSITNVGKIDYLLFTIYVQGPIVECFICYFKEKKMFKGYF